jgi:hypothetical protein
MGLRQGRRRTEGEVLQHTERQIRVEGTGGKGKPVDICRRKTEVGSEGADLGQGGSGIVDADGADSSAFEVDEFNPQAASGLENLSRPVQVRKEERSDPARPGIVERPHFESDVRFRPPDALPRGLSVSIGLRVELKIKRCPSIARGIDRIDDSAMARRWSQRSTR